MINILDKYTHTYIHAKLYPLKGIVPHFGN